MATVPMLLHPPAHSAPWAWHRVSCRLPARTDGLVYAMCSVYERGVSHAVQRHQPSDRPRHALWRSGVHRRGGCDLYALLGTKLTTRCMKWATLGGHKRANALLTVGGTKFRQLSCQLAMMCLQMMQNLVLQEGDVVKVKAATPWHRDAASTHSVSCYADIELQLVQSLCNAPCRCAMCRCPRAHM
jgi:hypothetical protein